MKQPAFEHPSTKYRQDQLKDDEVPSLANLSATDIQLTDNKRSSDRSATAGVRLMPDHKPVDDFENGLAILSKATVKLQEEVKENPRMFGVQLGVKHPDRPGQAAKKTMFFRKSTKAKEKGSSDTDYASSPNPEKEEDERHSAMTAFSKGFNMMTSANKMKKAIRHFKDALYYRPVRGDLDDSPSKFLLAAYEVQTSQQWQKFLHLLGWVFMALIFLEPSRPEDSEYALEHKNNHWILLGIEVSLLGLFWLDLLMLIYHKCNDKERSRLSSWCKNKKFTLNLLLLLCYTADLCCFHILYPKLIIRFATPLRPIKLIFHSRRLRRSLGGIMGSANEIIEILSFFVFISMTYALIGYRLIGDLDGEIKYDKYSSNYGDIGHAWNSMYIMLGGEGYPQIMYPAKQKSEYYLFYFIPYVAFSIMLLTPVPIAVFFGSFRKNISIKVISDRILEREALFACFMCIRERKDGIMVITKEAFKELLNNIFNSPDAEKMCEEIFNILDYDGNEYLELEEFFEIPEMMLNNEKVLAFLGFHSMKWTKLRTKFKEFLKLEVLTQSFLYNLIISCTALTNLGDLVVRFLVRDREFGYQPILLDVLVGIYAFDMGIKLFLGIRKFFADRFNQLDVLLLSITFVVKIPFTIGRFVLSFRELRTTKTWKRVAKKHKNKISVPGCFFKMYSSIRGWTSRFKRFIQKIAVCVPIVLKLVSFLVMVIYAFAFVSVELFHSANQIHSSSPYFPDQYSNFDTMQNAMVTLFQIIAQQSWTSIVYDTAYRFGYKFGAVVIFFNGFHFISNVVIISLIQGLILEVFTIIDENIEERAKLFGNINEVASCREKIASNAKMRHKFKEDQTGISPDAFPVRGRMHAATFANTQPRPETEFHKPLSKMVWENDESNASLISLTSKISSSMSRTDILVHPRLESTAAGNKKEASSKDSCLMYREPTRIEKFKNHFLKIQITSSEKNDNSQKEKNNGHPPRSQNRSKSGLLIGSSDYKNPASDRSAAEEGSEKSGQWEEDIERSKSANRKLSASSLIGADTPVSNLINSKGISSPSEGSPGVAQKRSKLEFYQAKLEKVTQSVCQGSNNKELDPSNLFDSEGEDIAALCFGNQPINYDTEEDNSNKYGDDDDNVDQEQAKEAEKLGETRNKRMLIAKSNINQDLILRKALLKGKNMEAVQQVEDDYLANLYGEQYEPVKQRAMVRVQELYNIGNKLTTQLSRISRPIKSITCNDYFEALFTIEETINHRLFPPGSISKFIFQNVKGKWFTLARKRVKGKSAPVLTFAPILKGPWDYYDSLFNEDESLYRIRDVFFSGENKKYEDYAEELHNSLAVMSSYSKSHFLETNKKEALWHLYGVPIDSKPTSAVVQHVRDKLMKRFGGSNNISENELRNATVKRCMLISCVLSVKNFEAQVHSDVASKSGLFKTQALKKGLLARSDDIFQEAANKSNKRGNEILPMSEILEYLTDWKGIMRANYNEILFKATKFYLRKKHEALHLKT